MIRKSIISLLLLMLIQVVKVSAQQVSIEGAYINSQYNGMFPFAQSKGGFQFGVGYLHPIKDSVLFFKTGLHYLQLDGEGTVNYVNQINQVVLSYQKTQEIYYLQIPLLLQCEVPLYDKTRIGFQVGLRGNYLLRAWQNPQPIGIEHNVSSNFERFVIGYQAGVYTKFKLSPIMGLEFSYQYGSNLTTVQKEASETGFVAHVFTVGLLYNIKSLFPNKKQEIPN
ncbi:MAG: outer membrane beta-barrel protein [Bacteroidota bacterium]|nr:outer membrane beta-barrel protein [Bacteroidota bacterium]